MFIDERIKHVGVSILRKLNADSLRTLGDNLYVLRDGDEPLAVLMAYDVFMRMQAEIEAAEARISQLK